MCARKHTRIGTMASSDDDDWVLVTHLETWSRQPGPVRVSLRRALLPLSYASVSTCYTSRAAAVCQARKDWPRSRVYLTHCLASGVLTRKRLQSPTDQFPLETIVCATQAVLALARYTSTIHGRIWWFSMSRDVCRLWSVSAHQVSLSQLCHHAADALCPTDVCGRKHETE